MITIVYANPNPDSFNHHILEAITTELTANGRDYNVIDLYADQFNPVLTMADMEKSFHGKPCDDLTDRYQKMLRNTGKLILIFPIWWGMMPAMIKGFVDKVFTKGIIYDTAPEGALLPMLSIGPCTIITTSQEDSAELDTFFNSVFIPQVLNPVGINRVTWRNCDHVESSEPAHRKAFVDEILLQVAQ